MPYRDISMYLITILLAWIFFAIFGFGGLAVTILTLLIANFVILAVQLSENIMSKFSSGLVVSGTLLTMIIVIYNMSYLSHVTLGMMLILTGWLFIMKGYMMGYVYFKHYINVPLEK